MNAETIINGKRMVLKDPPPPYIEVAIAPDIKDYWAVTDPLRRVQPVTINRQRHRLVRLVAEYELDSESRW